MNIERVIAIKEKMSGLVKRKDELNDMLDAIEKERFTIVNDIDELNREAHMILRKYLHE